MTSRDVTENTEQLLIHDSLNVIRDDLVAVIARLADLAEAHASTVMVARTHNVAAQATTLGKRFADAAAETMLGYRRVAELLDRYPLRGIKGPVGTRLDQLDLLGSAEAVDELESLVAEHLGFGGVLDASGQTYPRSLDLDVVAALVQAVSGPASLATTVRLMAGHGLVSEGFRDGQVASSAMPHKANARSSERIGALVAVLDGHLAMAASLAGRQWNEGDVSCSAARRVMLPDAFCAADGLLHTALGVLEELQIDEGRPRCRVRALAAPAGDHPTSHSPGSGRDGTGGGPRSAGRAHPAGRATSDRRRSCRPGRTARSTRGRRSCAAGPRRVDPAHGRTRAVRRNSVRTDRAGSRGSPPRRCPPSAGRHAACGTSIVRSVRCRRGRYRHA